MGAVGWSDQSSFEFLEIVNRIYPRSEQREVGKKYL